MGTRQVYAQCSWLMVLCLEQYSHCSNIWLVRTESLSSAIRLRDKSQQYKQIFLLSSMYE